MHYFFSYKFQIICLAFCTEFVQCTVYSVFFHGMCILLLHSPWRISLIWAGNFCLALDFPFKYWPLRPSTLCWAGLSILYCTTWYNISTYGCSMTMMMVMGNLLGIMKEILASSVILLQIHVVMVHPGTHLTCEKSWVPVQNQWVPVKKKKGVQHWKCLGLYVTRQLMCRHTPKLFITSILKFYWNIVTVLF